jgi:MFS family permease
LRSLEPATKVRSHATFQHFIDRLRKFIRVALRILDDATRGILTNGRWQALRHRDFRLLWLGLLVSFIGTQMQTTTVDWQIFQLLRDRETVIELFGWRIPLSADALGLGTLGLARVLPIIVFALIGGALADTGDRRKMMAIALFGGMLAAGALAAMSLAGVINTPLIYVLTALTTASAALGNPSRQALVPNLVPKQDFTNAVSLNTLIMQISQISGPALAGVLLWVLPYGAIYAINALSFLVALFALWRMSYRDTGRAGRARVSLGAIRDGFKFVFGTRLLRSTMLLDFWATFFSSARTMLPIVAGEILKTDSTGYGILGTAQAAGSVITGFLMTTRRDIVRQGRALLISVALYGVATALFGLSTWFAASYLLFALTGAADTVSTVIRNVIRQSITPDDMRGRMIGVNQIFFQGGPQLGELEAGLVGAALGVPFAIVSGGVATVLIATWMAWRYSDLRRYVHTS